MSSYFRSPLINELSEMSSLTNSAISNPYNSVTVQSSPFWRTRLISPTRHLCPTPFWRERVPILKRIMRAAVIPLRPIHPTSPVPKIINRLRQKNRPPDNHARPRPSQLKTLSRSKMKGRNHHHLKKATLLHKRNNQKMRHSPNRLRSRSLWPRQRFKKSCSNTAMNIKSLIPPIWYSEIVKRSRNSWLSREEVISSRNWRRKKPDTATASKVTRPLSIKSRRYPSSRRRR